MKIIYSLTFLFIVSCATSQKKDGIPDLESVEDKDFIKKSSQRYNEQKDYFSFKDKPTFSLADEALVDSDDVDNLKKVDVMDQILGMCLEKNYEEAFKLIEQNTDSYKTHPVYWNQVGTCFLIKKEYRKALMYFNKALEFKPNYAPALNNIGVMYRQQGDDQKAQVAFDKAVKSSSYAKTPRFNLAQVYLEYGLAKNAQTHLKVLLNDSPDDIIFNSIALSYLMLNDYTQALNFYNKVNPNLFEKAEYGISYSLALHRSGKKIEAQEVLNDVEIGKDSKYLGYYEQVKKEVLK